MAAFSTILQVATGTLVPLAYRDRRRLPTDVTGQPAMQSIPIDLVCGLEEISSHSPRNVSHILSIVDPEYGDIAGLTAHKPARHLRLRFHDVIGPEEGMVMPTAEDVAAILRFGDGVQSHADGPASLLVHCHMGVSRSTAAMVSILARRNPDAGVDALFETLRGIRPQAWPNSVMIAHADALLDKGGALNDALGRHYAFQLRRDPRMGDWIAALGRGREVEMAGTG